MRTIVYTLVILLVADLCLSGLYLLWVHRVVDQARGSGPFDAGVLFFSGSPDGGLDDESLLRTDFAAGLFAHGKAPKLLCIGGHRRNPERFGAEMMAARLHELGVPLDAIVVDRVSYDTVSNWRQAVNILRDHGWRRPLLISGPIHLARIRHIAAKPFPIALAPARSVPELLRDAPWSAWLRVHREWAAWAVMLLLPDGVHQQLLQRWRDLWG